MPHFHPKISAIKGIITDFDKIAQDESINFENFHRMSQIALGAINGISDLKGEFNANKTRSKTRVRK